MMGLIKNRIRPLLGILILLLITRPSLASNECSHFLSEALTNELSRIQKEDYVRLRKLSKDELDHYIYNRLAHKPSIPPLSPRYMESPEDFISWAYSIAERGQDPEAVARIKEASTKAIVKTLTELNSTTHIEHIRSALGLAQRLPLSELEPVFYKTALMLSQKSALSKREGEVLGLLTKSLTAWKKQSNQTLPSHWKPILEILWKNEAWGWDTLSVTADLEFGLAHFDEIFIRARKHAPGDYLGMILWSWIQNPRLDPKILKAKFSQASVLKRVAAKNALLEVGMSQSEIELRL